jgi:alpha-amylase
MKKIYLIFGIHNHQPVGNFDHIFKEAFYKAYMPFLEELIKYPKIRIAFHTSGPIYEWAEKHFRSFLDILKSLRKTNQIEFLGGGFYEPILSQIPRDDIKEQIELMKTYIKDTFDYEIKGIWLAERVWDESLPEILNALNIKYTILDDTHFFYAGLTEKECIDYYITEKRGASLYLFPIDKYLRYKIPFGNVEEIISYLHNRYREEGKDILGITYADDGEKFGIWPGTYKHCYERNWLKNFFDTISKQEMIEVIPFSDFLERKSAYGKVFIPPASYDEMMEWSLPQNKPLTFMELKQKLQQEGNYEKYKAYIRGGMWDNFLIKYEQSNLMHKKGLWVKKKLDKLTSIPQDIKKHYLMAQCNCSYWHGLFGGVYLNYIRDANYYNYLIAERETEKLLYKDKDFQNLINADYDVDGKDEIIYENKYINLIIKPDYKASIMEIDYKPKGYNITNIIKRRWEYYYNLVRKREDRGKVETIHAGIYVDDTSILQEAFEDNERALKLYKRMGFVEVKRAMFNRKKLISLELKHEDR